MRDTGAAASIVIPAHNERSTIARLLSGLLGGVAPGTWQIVVVCNGCNDDTAEIARGFGDDVTVVEIPEPSKGTALRRGDDDAHCFPRIYLDADVEMTGDDIRELVTAFADDRILAAGPRRVVPRRGTSILVRAYYDVWERLPQIQSGLFARGVIAVSAAGYERIRTLPSVLSDDLAVSEAFSPHERSIVPTSTVVVHPPRTMRDLLRRRIRVNTGNAQLDAMNQRSAAVRTSPADLLSIARAEPMTAVKIPVFLAVAVLSRLRARRLVNAGDFTTWLRDDSSRES